MTAFAMKIGDLCTRLHSGRAQVGEGLAPESQVAEIHIQSMVKNMNKWGWNADGSRKVRCQREAESLARIIFSRISIQRLRFGRIERKKAVETSQKIW